MLLGSARSALARLGDTPAMDGPQEVEQKYLLKLSGCKMKEVKKGGTWTGKTRHVFEVYNPDLRCVRVRT